MVTYIVTTNPIIFSSYRSGFPKLGTEYMKNNDLLNKNTNLCLRSTLYIQHVTVNN